MADITLENNVTKIDLGDVTIEADNVTILEVDSYLDSNSANAVENRVVYNIASQLGTLENRVNEIETLPAGTTQGNLELVSIREDYFDYIHPTAQDAVNAITDLVVNGTFSVPITDSEVNWTEDTQSSSKIGIFNANFTLPATTYSIKMAAGTSITYHTATTFDTLTANVAKTVSLTLEEPTTDIKLTMSGGRQRVNDVLNYMEIRQSVNVLEPDTLKTIVPSRPYANFQIIDDIRYLSDCYIFITNATIAGTGAYFEVWLNDETKLVTNKIDAESGDSFNGLIHMWKIKGHKWAIDTGANLTFFEADTFPEQYINVKFTNATINPNGSIESVGL